MPCGSTGEYNAITAEERVSVLRFVKEFAEKQETPIAGTNAGSTSDHADLQFGVWSAKWGQDEVVNQYSHLAIEKSEVIRPQAVFDANQALADCETCLALLAQTLPKSGSRLMSLKQWTFIQAFKVGEAAAIAPVEYARLLYAAVIGIVFLPRFRPHGLSVVRGSSSRVRCYTLHRNALKKRQKAPDGPQAGCHV